jgi:hypothetical protein
LIIGRLVVFLILITCPWSNAASLVGYAEADAGVVVPNVKNTLKKSSLNKINSRCLKSAK